MVVNVYANMATNAISLNGSTQYGEVSPNSLIDTMIAGTGTAEGWFWNDTTSTEDYMQAFCLANSDASVWAMRLENDQPGGSTGVNFAWDYSTTNANGYTASGVFEASTWVHIAIVCQNGSVTKVYKNGTEISYSLQNTPSGTPTSAASLYCLLGWDRDISSSYWKGYIGGFFRLWGRVRTNEAIRREMYNNLRSAFEDRLLVNLQFKEGSGTTVANESYSDYPMNLINSPSWTSGPDIVDKQYPRRYANNTRPRPFAPGIAR